MLQVFLPYQRYVRWLKWLTLALLAYVAVVFTLQLNWWQVARSAMLAPPCPTGTTMLLMVVAVFGTTISPYLFFWQAAQEVEDIRRRRPAAHGRRGAPPLAAHQDRHHRRHDVLQRDRLLHHPQHRGHAARRGQCDIETSAQAAEALRPLAGEFTFLLFSLGIIGTGMLAVPVLAGSAAYAVAEAAGWHGSLSLRLDRGEGRGFYGVIAAATLGGVIAVLHAAPTRSRSCSGPR